MAQLRINLLGPPQVLWDNSPLNLPRKMLRAMLYYLACHPQGVGRGELCALFWPEEHTETEARTHLRTALAKLRAGLPEAGLLVTGMDQVSLDFGRVEVDVAQFRELGQESYKISLKLPRSQPLPERIAAQMIRAVTLWRTPHFLGGANLPSNPAFDSWLRSLSNMLESSRLGLILRLIDHSESLGDLEAALMWSRVYLLQSDDPADPLYGRVIGWLLDLGRRSEAQSYLTQLQAYYQQDGAGPLPAELTQVFRKVRQVLNQPLPAPEKSAWVLDLPPSAPFVGRDELLTDLRLAFRRGGVVALSGESGSGKTRLLHEFFRLLQPEPRLVLVRAGAALTNLPFHPLASALRQEVTEKEWRRLDPIWLPHLSQLLPELVRFQPEKNPGAGQSPGIGAEALYEAVRQLLSLLTQNRRLLLVLDNAQSSDLPTLEALAYLVERGFFVEHGLLIIAYRPEETQSPLADWLAALYSASPVVRLILPPLEFNEVAELAQAALRRPPLPGLVHGLLRDTGGNPQFVSETLQALLDYTAHQGSLEGLEHLPTAGSLNALLNERLRRLRPATREVVEMAAVLGSEFSLDVLESCLRVSQEDLVAAVEELEGAKLVFFKPELHPAGGYAFIHAQVPNLLVFNLSPARQRMLHLRAAQALEQLPGSTDMGAANLARHYEAAGRLQTAAGYWMQAAHHDQRLFSPGEAYRAFGRAEQLVLRLGDQAPEDLIYRLYTRWGETAFNLNDQPAQQQAYSTLLAVGERRGSPLLIGSALSGLANFHFPARIEPQMLEKIERALFFLRQAGNPGELAEALNRRGSILLSEGRYQEALQDFVAASQASGSVLLTGNSPDPALVAIHFNAASRVGVHHIYTGWPERARDLALQDLAEAGRLGFSPGAAQAHMSIANAQSDLGNFARSLEHYRMGRVLAEASRQHIGLGYLLLAAAQTNFYLGHLDECWQVCQEILDLARRISFPALQTHVCIILGQLYAALGDFAAAVNNFSQGAAGQPGYEQTACTCRLAVFGTLPSRPQEALEKLDQIIAQAKQAGMGTVYLPASLGRILALERLGQPAPARAEAARLAGELDERCHRVWAVVNRLVQAYLEWKAGDIPQAALAAGQALADSRQMNFPWGELYGLALLRRLGREAEDGPARLSVLLAEMGRHAALPETAGRFARFARLLKTTI